MKKIGCFLLSAVMLFPLAACGSTSSDTSSTSEPSDETFMAGYQDLYLAMDETYNLKKMLAYNAELENIDEITVTLSSDIATYENGIIVPQTTGSCTLSLSQGEHLQRISLNIVETGEYDMSHMSIDVGRFYDKNIVFFGDSITHNWAKYPNGDNKTVNNTTALGYPSHYIVQLNTACQFKSVTNCAWSAGTMAVPPSNSKEREVYKCFAYCTENNETAIKNADYIFIWYGTNDYNDFFEIGSEDDVAQSAEKKSTFMGGMNYGLNKINEYNPNAKIIVSNLLARTCNTSEGAVKEKELIEYNTAIETIVAKRKLRLLDMFSLFTSAEMRAKGNSQSNDVFYTNDGLHPNDLGYTVITKFILNNGVASDELKK